MRRHLCSLSTPVYAWRSSALKPGKVLDDGYIFFRRHWPWLTQWYLLAQSMENQMKVWSLKPTMAFSSIVTLATILTSPMCNGHVPHTLSALVFCFLSSTGGDPFWGRLAFRILLLRISASLSSLLLLLPIMSKTKTSGTPFVGLEESQWILTTPLRREKKTCVEEKGDSIERIGKLFSAKKTAREYLNLSGSGLSRITFIISNVMNHVYIKITD